MVVGEGGEIQTLSTKQSNVCSLLFLVIVFSSGRDVVIFSPSVQHNVTNFPFSTFNFTATNSPPVMLIFVTRRFSASEEFYSLRGHAEHMLASQQNKKTKNKPQKLGTRHFPAVVLRASEHEV